MVDQHYQNEYKKGLELAEAGNYSQALDLINVYLQENPFDGEALNDAGVILHCMSRDSEAINCFLKARDARPDDVQVLWNLTESYIANGNIEEVVSLLGPLNDANLLNPELLNRAASKALECGDKLEAIELLLDSMYTWPGQEVLEPMLVVIKSKMPKIAFVSSVRLNQSKFGGIHGYLKERYRTEFYNINDGLKFSDINGDEDFIWINNCPEFAADITCYTGNYKIVLDLTNCELSDKVAAGINWDNIDVVLTSREILLPANIMNKVVKVGFGVNFRGYHSCGRQRGKNIVCFDRIDAMSNSMMLIQCMQKLHYVDSEYKLYFAGGSSSVAVERYLRNMVSVLDLDGVVNFVNPDCQADDILADKHFAVSASVDRSGVENMLYGMYNGLKPIVHQFPGACGVFGTDFTFNIAEDFCRVVLDSSYEPEAYRQKALDITCNNYKFKAINHRLSELSNQNSTEQKAGIVEIQSFQGTF